MNVYESITTGLNEAIKLETGEETARVDMCRIEKKISVPLKLVIEGIESADDNWNNFLDTEKLEIISTPNGVIDSGLSDEFEEEIELVESDTNNRFVPLPSKYEINEYHIIQNYVDEISVRSIRTEFVEAIRGKGAFRRFKNCLIRFDLLQAWYDYQAKAYREIAIEWCEINGFDFTE